MAAAQALFLPPDPAPRPPGFDAQLARSVERKRQQLERDIAAYIERRRQELRAYEQELLAQHRSMECSDDKHAHAKRTKHSRVQKREKELYGLVTPVFLPLLDARDSSPAMEDAVKKSRRASTPTTATTATTTTTRKSALRTPSSTKPRRKRVSLVIDGHTVLPADTPADPALASPSSETTSASNSTASLDDMIDPRLLSHTPDARIQTHSEATHHSLPLPMSNTMHSPTKPLIDNTPLSSPIPQPFITPAPLLPALPSPDPIPAEEEEGKREEEAHFDTYVGGLRGSGADDVDQAGSYGYPSSLGASYLETYMQSRPLRVRIEVVEKAGLQGVEKAGMVKGRREEEAEDKAVEEEEEEEDVEEPRAMDDGRDGGDEDVDIMGEMEGV
ncbi:hypothetical protein BDU57DRAFT_158282 [Ampelomyces quisqualis]|uniref:Uncharacterized protein n=1 Tax=Ampelomyces quisqualis TaxID=50730 RepID=A0A6A5QTG3_AMPQU|nr:hypothetical protein BDU57DRAFT_158282 [Ampelomyces quisqualis]